MCCDHCLDDHNSSLNSDSKPLAWKVDVLTGKVKFMGARVRPWRISHGAVPSTVSPSYHDTNNSRRCLDRSSVSPCSCLVSVSLLFLLCVYLLILSSLSLPSLDSIYQFWFLLCTLKPLSECKNNNITIVVNSPACPVVCEAILYYFYGLTCFLVLL